MKLGLSLFFILFLNMIALAQTTVSGKVTDTDGSPVASASVTIEEPGKDAIMAYAISNSKGEYKVTFTSSEANVDLKIKAFNHKPITKSISNTTQNLNFSLDPDATEIKEVKIKTKLITKRGDTISYDLKAFESKADRTLADVLKKIPGIEVNSDGTVLYQGEAINKFYVNGKDLMEGGYGTVNNSLPKDAVQKIEVMENYQPVKILQDKVPSENAAINVKLKNSVTMTGRGEVGVGLTPLLWNVKLTPMFFGQKNQWVVNYKANNTGESVENEGNMLAFGSRWEGRRVQSSQNDWLNVENSTKPNLPERRYLLNNVHFFSANLLTNPFKNKEWELKVNGNYTNNVVERESYTEQNDFQNQTKYSTNIHNFFYTDKAKGEVIFTKNAKKGFFKNTTTFTQFWNADRANVALTDRINSRNGAEAIQSPTSSFQNSLSTIVPWKEKMVNVMSYISYQNDRQTLQITPSSYVKIPVAYDEVNQDWEYFDFGDNTKSILQNIGLKTFTANHSVNMGFNKKKWTFMPEIGYNFTTNSLNSSLFGATDFGDIGFNSDYYNDIRYTNSVPYAAVNVNFKSDSWLLFAQMPVNFNHIEASDIERNVDKSLDKVTFEPSFFAQYSFASFWKAGANGNISNSFGDINDMYAGRILTSPSNFSFMAADNPINQIVNKGLGGSVEYRNPLNNLFFNVRYQYSYAKRNLTADILNLGSIASSVRYIVRDNNTTSNTYSAEVGKYFPKFKTNASLNYRNTKSESFQIRNNQDINNENLAQSFGFKFNNTYFTWMSVDFNFTYTWNSQNSITGSEFRTTGYNHNLAAYFYPIKNNTIGFYWDQLNSANENINYKNGFYDLSYQYTWDKKKIDFELKWMNIANKKLFENYTVDATSDNYTAVRIRPSQVMFTVKFNFK